jgi:hypothetical protein
LASMVTSMKTTISLDIFLLFAPLYGCICNLISLHPHYLLSGAKCLILGVRKHSHLLVMHRSVQRIISALLGTVLAASRVRLHLPYLISRLRAKSRVASQLLAVTASCDSSQQVRQHKMRAVQSNVVWKVSPLLHCVSANASQTAHVDSAAKHAHVDNSHTVYYCPCGISPSHRDGSVPHLFAVFE